MRSSLRWSVTALFMLYALLSSFRTLYGVSGPRPEIDPVAAFGKAIEPVRQALPTNGSITFVTARPFDPLRPNTAFFLSQYYLAPLVVNYHSLGQGSAAETTLPGPYIEPTEMVVGNFLNEKSLNQFMEETGYSIHAKLQDNVYLLK